MPLRRCVVIGLALVMALTAEASGARANTGRTPVSPMVSVSPVSQDPNAKSGEPWVATNPRDPDQVVVVWTSENNPLNNPQHGLVYCGLARSSDGGKSWVHGELPVKGPGLGCGDPALAAGPDGTFYALEGNELSNGQDDLVTSSDGGATWSQPVEVFGPERWLGATPGNRAPTASFDRPYIAVDPETGAIYASASDDALWGRAVSVSTDHGKSWSLPQLLDPNGQSDWGDNIAAAHGLLAAAYVVDPSSLSYRLARPPAVTCAIPCVVFETSRDQGATWSRHVLPTRDVPGGNLVNRPANPRLAVAADPNRAGTYAALVPTKSSSTLEIWVSTDSGARWRRVKVLTAPAGDSQARWWLAYSANGALGVVWRTIRPDGSYNVLATVSTDAGSSFGPIVALTPTAAAPLPGPEVPGDDCACNVNVGATWLSAAWPDARSGQRQIYLSRFDYLNEK